MERIPAAYRRQLGRNIREQRIRKNFTQKKLAILLGVTQSVLSQYEAGDKVPSMPRLDTLAHLLGCSINFLYPVAKRKQLK